MTANGPASSRYVEDAVNVILKVHRTQGPGHILAFFTGQDEIERVCRLLGEAMAQHKAQSAEFGIGSTDDNGENERPLELLVVPLFGALSADAQAEAFRPARQGLRKVLYRLFLSEDVNFPCQIIFFRLCDSGQVRVTVENDKLVPPPWNKRKRCIKCIFLVARVSRRAVCFGLDSGSGGYQHCRDQCYRARSALRDRSRVREAKDV